MIRLTRLNHDSMILNSDLIEHIETTPDTVIALVGGQRWIVRESADEVLERIITFRQRIHHAPAQPAVIEASGQDLPEGYGEEG